MPIAELFLSAFLQVLFDRLTSVELLNFARRKGINTLLKDWEQMLKSIQKVLDDAEDKQLTDQAWVKVWLEDLRNLAYDIEDLLDEFVIESVESKSKTGPSTSKAHSLLPSCCFKWSPREFTFNHEMRSKIEEMDAALREITKRKDNLSPIENNRKQSTNHLPGKPIPTTHLTENCFVGRQDKIMEILKLLTGEEDDRPCTDIKVIPIVGMPGLGKTALAQRVFNDAGVTSYFDAKAWVCVSDDFNMPAITKSILQKINCTLACDNKDLDWLQDKLKENLSGKKFLVVLDDIWNESYEMWTKFLKPFQSGVKGSKIIITTRKFLVAEIAGARPYTLEVLSQDTCVTLFAFHALGVRNFDDYPYLKELGLKIVKKCKGLPLVVKTLAGLLRTKVSSQEWQAVLDSKIWDLPEKRNDVLPALKLSYLDLPSNLRRCFAYCAIFPKDYEIQQDELIHWWIADGFVNQWNVGLNYFNELVNRSLFQKSSSNGSQFLMHDLVNDLAKLVAGASHYSSGEFEFADNHNNAPLARHASFLPSKNIMPERLKIYHQMQGLRSFISLEKQYQSPYVSQKVLHDLLSRLKYLRVLSLNWYYISEVPECIDKLRHLRHLNLWHTHIETLPKSIVALHNLEALMLRGCYKLIKLPEGMEKMINLRFLDITDTPNLRAMPLNIGNLLGLEILSKFIVGTENGSRLNELRNLKNLQKELCIFDLHEVQEVREAKDANLLMKEGICRLNMRWCTNFEDFRNEELETKVLDFLCPHQNLAHLEISYYGGLKFPSWLGSPTHVNIMHLHLHGCQRVKALPSLGQLSSLKELYIEGLNAICMVGSEFYGSRSPFPSLLTLEFKGMPLWEYWSHCIDTEEIGVVFPRLEHLVIWDCPMLMGRLPSQLSSLVKLEINSCPRMEASPSFNSLPSLSELKFKGCNERVVHSLVNLTSLTALNINDVAELTCLNHEFTSSLIKLEKLEIEKCAKLIYLWQDGDVIWNLNCLKRLVVRSCSEFIYFVAEENDIKLPSNLETIELENCINLEKLPSKMYTLSSLKDLMVSGCPKLVSFLEIGIPTSLTSLVIEDCEMLQSLPRGLSAHLDEPSSSTSNTSNDIISCLQYLIISGCNSLSSSPFSEGIFLPTTLKRLDIGYCRGVESLAEINLEPLQSIQQIEIQGLENLRSLPQGLHKLSRLTYLYLGKCPALELECFPPLPPNISIFRLEDCPKIKSLPNQLHRLTSLHHLDIRGCERLTRFPEGGLPPQLESLVVRVCKNMKQPMRERFTSLTSLKLLSIKGSVGEVGEEEDLVLPLPSSLTFLFIGDLGEVERLSSSLPPSLRTLQIERCPKLRELPQDGLPPSLEDLRIYNCPILEERCKKGTGRYWPLIREIPKVILSDDYHKSIT